MMRPSDNGPSLEAQWVRVRARLKVEFGEAAYRSWLKPLTLVSQEDGVVRIAVPTRFMQDWVRQHYADRIKSLWRAENKAIRLIEVIVQMAAPPMQSSSTAQPGPGSSLFVTTQGARTQATSPSARVGMAPPAPAVARAGQDDVEDFGAPLTAGL
ncbi:MAG: chromosomal replication initiator protein DnaA, partial [Proteobacteria bacterium]|nr:chromosomal replication initiator protein DnaA [Pseudomonadota bacterium]